jgi:hypothetical protein
MIGSIVCFGQENTDTIKTNYTEFRKLKCPKGNYLITDIFGKNYKTVSIKDPGQIIQSCVFDTSVIKIDTSIYVGFDMEDDSLRLQHKVFFNYFRQYIKNPVFTSSDPAYAVVSFIVDKNSELRRIYVLKDVPNRCGTDTNWVITYSKGISFSPVISNGKIYTTEYLVQVEIYSFCVPLIEKKHYNQ